MWPEEILAVVAPPLRDILRLTPGEAEEIRIRVGQPLGLRNARGDVFVTRDGTITSCVADAYRVRVEDVQRTVELITGSSLYALEEELRSGYITISGGHRVGLAGEAVIMDGQVKTMKNISSLNIRVAREIKGCASLLLPYLLGNNRHVLHTLIISPPKCGKTTVLRDVVRQLSQGIPELGFGGVQVGVVDERSEIAGCYRGRPQKDVGPRTDVLDACPKAQGMIMLVRAMSPQVVATDELGKEEDAVAVAEVLNAGITLIATAHGHDLEEVARRPLLRDLVRERVFQRYVVLGTSLGPGTVEHVFDGSFRDLVGRPFRGGPGKC